MTKFEASVYEIDAIIRTIIKATFESFWEMSVEHKNLDKGGALYDEMLAAEKAVDALINNDFKTWGSYTLPPPELPENQDAHTEHCCGKHKVCKYGKETTGCTVATGKKAPSLPCNCNWM